MVSKYCLHSWRSIRTEDSVIICGKTVMPRIQAGGSTKHQDLYTADGFRLRRTPINIPVAVDTREALNHGESRCPEISLALKACYSVVPKACQWQNSDVAIDKYNLSWLALLLDYALE